MLKSINSWTGQPRDELAQMVAMLREQDQTECHMQRLAAQIGSWPVLPPATLDCKGVAEISLHIWSWRTAQERDWRSRSCWTASSRVLPTWSRRTLCQVVQQHPRQSPACHPDPPHSQQSQRSVKASAPSPAGRTPATSPGSLSSQPRLLHRHRGPTGCPRTHLIPAAARYAGGPLSCPGL